MQVIELERHPYRHHLHNKRTWRCKQVKLLLKINLLINFIIDEGFFITMNKNFFKKIITYFLFKYKSIQYFLNQINDIY